MNSGITMFIYALILTIILYIIMKYMLNQSNPVAQDRSILIGAIVLIYLILFGYSMPNKINSNIM